MSSRVPPMLQDIRTAPSPVLAIRIPVPLRIIGLVVLTLVGLLLVALLTWSIDDPSFSYATDKPPANWLGFPGAAVSDICFQLFGIAIYAMLVPPALWGWNLMRRRLPRRFGLRILAWLMGAALTTGVFAFIAVPVSWPLPTGLGGLAGQGFALLASFVFGEMPGGGLSLLIALVLLGPAFGLMWLAMGLGSLAPVAMPKAAAGRRGAPASRTEPPLHRETPEFDAGDEGGGLMDVVIGGLVHLGYSARSAFRRARTNLREKRAAEEQPWREAALEPEFAPGMADDVRVEPPLASPRRPIHIATEPSAYAEPLEYPDEEDDAPAMPPQTGRGHIPGITGPRMQPTASRSEPGGRGAGPRVTAPAPRPVPGQRAMREAQPSLLDEGGAFELPPLSLLAEPKQKGINPEHTPERLEATARKLETVLEDFGVKGDIINVRPGPVVTLYELEPAPGIKSSRVISLADDIARSMSAISARVAVVPGRNAIGIELPNQQRETVFLREMLASADFEKNKGKLPICLGKTIGGEPVIADLARMPHLLIAGTTGSGKSVGINTFILSLLYRMTPEQCRLIMIDPKMLELSIYDGIPHLLTPVVTDPSKAVTALKWAVREMEDRYRKMSKIGVRNIDGFNQRVGEARARGEIITRTVQTGFDRETGEAIFETEAFDLEPLPFIVVIVDEMADLMMVAGKDIEGAIQRLAQMARAAGIHMITATQRPSVDVITGTIKANFPTRISFMVTSKIDSRTILGEQGAEQLLGNGDMLYMAGGGRIRRLHGPFVADGEVEAIVGHLKMQGTPEYLDSVTAEEAEMEEAGGFTGESDEAGGSGDELYDRAVHIVLTDKKASTSYIQRRLAVGYNKAATLIERMEKEGVISPANHAGKREILVGGDAEQY